MRLVVVGGVAAGTKAAAKARRMDPGLEIIIYQAEAETSIGECGLPYLLSGTVESRERLIARTPEDFARQEIEVHVRHRVESVDPERKTLTVRNLESGEEFEDHYDRLLLATGAAANLPPIPGAELEGVSVLRFLSDADRILAHIREHSPRRAVIVGAGYIGLEVAENLRELGMEVCIVELGDRVLPGFDAEISKNVERHLQEKGVRSITGQGVKSIRGSSGRVRAVQVGEAELPADLVIAGVGVRPEVGLAEGAGVELGETGAIRVDGQLRTNVPDVWAAGDCVETPHLVSGEPVWVPLGDTANQMGRVAGINLAGGSVEFPGVLGTGVFKVFDLGVSKTGLSEAETSEAGFSPVCATVEAKSRAGYYPGWQTVFLKLVADRRSGRLLGAEAVGGSADKLADVCATAISGRLTYLDLLDLDLAYAPPFGPTLSPVITAAGVLENKFEGSLKGIGADQTREHAKEFQVVDVQPSGTATHHLKGSTRVPLEELDDRYSELDLTAPIVLYCGTGQCSYQAAIKLRNAGARDVQVLEGGLWGWPYDEDRETAV